MSLSLTRPDGARLSYRVTGSGPDLMLISGLGGTAAFWEPVIAALGAGQRIITLDQRGIAASSRGPEPVTIDTLAEDCLAILDSVGSEQAAIVGHSTGGVIAQSMGLMAPDRINGLALTATWARAVASAAYLLVVTLIGLAMGPYTLGRLSVATGDLRIALTLGLLANVVAFGCFWQAKKTLAVDEASRIERARAAGEG